MQSITTYAAFQASLSPQQRVRARLRDMAIRFSPKKPLQQDRGWISFPYYHHVFDDERRDFERQLKFMGNHGDFISIDDAVAMIAGQDRLAGHYFCITFDDGFASLHGNMMPITAALNVPVAVYLPTDYIGLDPEDPAQSRRIAQFYPEAPRLVPFLSWQQCREMIGAGVCFGSHTVTHARLSTLDEAAMARQMTESKQVIESRLDMPCHHFAAPWGQAVTDFDPVAAVRIARETGFASFVTTNRGRSEAGGDPFHIRRDHTLAGASNAELRYFLWA